MKKAMVTGATGFVGNNLVKKLLSKGIGVIAIVRDRTQAVNTLPKCNSIDIVECDLQEIAKLGNVNIDKDVDVLYHLAWDGVATDHRNNFSLQLTNVGYSLNCIVAAKEIGIRRVIFLGSTMEYAYNEKPIDETVVATSESAYGRAKIASRNLGAQLANNLGLEFVYAVTTSVYGIGREDNNVIYYVIDKLLNNEKPSLTKMEQKWDFIHINDLTEALFSLGRCEKVRDFYAIGKGDNLPLLNFILMIRDMINPSLPLGLGEVPYTSNNLSSSCINTSALKADTGFEARIDFREGIKEVIDYYRVNKNKR